MFDIALQWFFDKEGGLQLNLHALKKNSDLAEDFVTFVTQYVTLND